MAWTDDANAVDNFDRLMRQMKNPLVSWMNSMTEYLDGSPNSVIIRLMAKCVLHYNTGCEELNLTETESYGYMISQISADPELQNMMQGFSMMMMNRGAGLE